MRSKKVVPAIALACVCLGCPKQAVRPGGLDTSVGLTDTGKRVQVLVNYDRLDKCTVVTTRQDENTFCEGCSEQDAKDTFLMALRNTAGAKGATHVYVDVLTRGYVKGRFCQAKLIDSLELSCPADLQ